MDDTVIEEKESQPFVMDYLDDLIDEDPRIQTSPGFIQAHVSGLSQCEAALSSCPSIGPSKTHYTILYSWSHNCALKQAQNIWNQLARAKQLDWIDSHTVFTVRTITCQNSLTATV